MVKDFFVTFAQIAIVCQEVNGTIAVILILDTKKSIVEVILQIMRSMSRLQNDDYAYREEGSSQPSKWYSDAA